MPELPNKAPMDGSASPSARTVAWSCRLRRLTLRRGCRPRVHLNVNILWRIETTEELRRPHGDGSAGLVAMQSQVRKAQGNQPDPQVQELRTL